MLHSCYVAHKCVEAAEWTSEILRLPELAAREGPTPLVMSLASIRGPPRPPTPSTGLTPVPSRRLAPHQGEVRVVPDGGANFTTTVEDEARVASSSEFGTLLRRYRLAAGLSQEALAERARMSTMHRRSRAGVSPHSATRHSRASVWRARAQRRTTQRVRGGYAFGIAAPHRKRAPRRSLARYRRVKLAAFPDELRRA